MAGGLEAKCCFVRRLVHVRGWLKVLPLLGLVIISVVLCYALDLAFEMLPGYRHDVKGCVFVFGGIAVCCLWVVCYVKVCVDLHSYLV